MSKLIEKSFPVVLLAFGGLILLVSLVAANSTLAGDRTRLMSRKIYFSKTILPDNIFYPFMMISDRIKLATAGNEQKVLLQVEYAQRRSGYAVQLLEKKQPVLALTTMTKSQKYLFTAGNQVLADPGAFSTETVETVAQTMAQSLPSLAKFKQNYTGTDAQTIDDLSRETEIIYQKLSTLDAQTNH